MAHMHRPEMLQLGHSYVDCTQLVHSKWIDHAGITVSLLTV